MTHPLDHRRVSSQWIPEDGKFLRKPSFFRKRNDKGSRMILPNHLVDASRYDLPNYKKFSNNSISTTKYSLLTFIPFNIFHQLRTRYANLYFFFIAFLNFFKIFAAYNKWIALIPPAFVIGTTMLKDGFEDFRRWRFDRDINNRWCHVWDKSRQAFRKTMWKYVLVGDFVHISNDEDLPADILLLRSSNENGTCFVETSNLDGETSLKQRSVPQRYLPYSLTDSGFKPPMFTGAVFCEKPDKAIYTVRAKIEYEPGQSEVVLKENMLLRGSKLKNTTFVEGIVMYAGHDTKVMQNNGRAPHKISGIEKMTNWFIIVCLLILIIMVAVGAILSGFWLNNNGDDMTPYMSGDTPSPVAFGFIMIGTLIICYQVMVPIALYITVELIKFAQVFFMGNDLDLYDEDQDYPLSYRSLNINEELGQITHILSDKTGTLTENKMIFRNCAIDTIDFGGEYDPAAIDKNNPIASGSLKIRVKEQWNEDRRLREFFLNILINNSVIVNKVPHNDAIEEGTLQGNVFLIGNSAFFDVSKKEYRKRLKQLSQQPDKVHPLDILPEICETGDIEEQADRVSSPSSLAATPTTESKIIVSRVSSVSKSIAKTVKKRILTPIASIIPSSDSQGFEDLFKQKDFCPYEAESPDELALIKGAELYDLRLLDRTGTYILLQMADGTRIKYDIALVMPFDSRRKRMSVVISDDNGEYVMYTKGADSAMFTRIRENVSDDHVDDLKAHVHEYSCRGLRTLCFGMRRFSPEEFEEFKQSYEWIMRDSSDERESLLSECADKIERDLELIGVTGIEDRLQDGVAETISAMREAGIQVWVLTGDKLETAENVARGSGLFEEQTRVLRVTCVEDVLHLGLDSDFNMIISPEALKLIQEGNEAMINALEKAKAVLCFRMTPAEKATIVTTVKKSLKARTLAIGDGANDVPMIQAAHVGIGVKGKEGMQAVMACDFAIGRFRFLKKLLLVHGHWNYDRLALSFLYFLYKNANCVFLLFFYQFFNGYSGSFTIDPTYSVLYPIIFTALQPIIVGVLDQDHSAEELMKNPSLYSPGRLGLLYTNWLFALNVIDGIWQAAVVYFVCQYALWETHCELWLFGFYLATGMMFVNSFHLMLEVRAWTKWILLMFIFFFVIHFGFFFLYSLVMGPGTIPDPPIGIPLSAASDASFWMCTFISVVMGLLPRFIAKVVSQSFVQ